MPTDDPKPNGELVLPEDKIAGDLDTIPNVSSEDGTSASPPKLENHIPFHLLPKNLIIHGPDNVLSVGTNISADQRAETYRFRLEEGANQSIESSRKIANAEEEAKRAAQHNFLVVQITDGSQASRPWIVYSHPPRPSPPTQIPEAHLYLSSSSKCGAILWFITLNGSFLVIC
jgi:hypothetical protein